MDNRTNALEWLKASLDDLKAVKVLLENDKLTNIAAFHAQQSIEKALKSLVEYKRCGLQRTHNLIKLYNQVNDMIEIENLLLLEMIDELYIDSRYPGDMGLLPDGKPTLEEAETFYSFANDVFSQVCEVLNIQDFQF